MQLILALQKLQKKYLLVLVIESENEDPSLDNQVNSFLLQSKIDIYSTLEWVQSQEASLREEIKNFCKVNGTIFQQSLLIQANLKVTFFLESPLIETESFLSPSLSLYFHTYDDIVSWILSHPIPYQNVLTSLVLGAKIIQEGGLVAFPTETVYGLGSDATNESAVKKIFTAKKRPSYDPLIVHVSHLKEMLPLVKELPEKAQILISKFWPGPLTIVLPKSSLIPDIVTSTFPSVAIRMPNNPIALELIRLSGKPIAAPSANLFGYTSPTTAQHVKQQLGGTYGAIIDGGGCTVGIESTVISFLEETPRILRPGGIDQKAIESCIGKVLSQREENDENLSISPGMMPSHYATTTPLLIVDNLNDYATRSDVGVLLFGKSNQLFSGPVEYLSLTGDPKEAAKKLYQAMRKLDGLSLSLLVATLLPETGIGVAVNNRLIKAAFKEQKA
ncbi:MAG: threonylcarbamoyl-AMP synthase [Spirochaetia bacterium]|nr:threonylcarbamoyl-AMP synthase [Spirochaetia bacterium]